MIQVEVHICAGEDSSFQYFNVGIQKGTDFEAGAIEISIDSGLPNETFITIGVWESLEPKPYPRVIIIHGDWTLEGELESVEQISTQETRYHCRNSLFPFVIFVKTLSN